MKSTQPTTQPPTTQPTEPREPASDPGPQRGPASVPQINAQVKQARREISDRVKDIDNQNASWVIRNYRGEIVVRDKGKVLYAGKESEMPADVAKIAAEFQSAPAQPPPTKPAATASEGKERLTCDFCGKLIVFAVDRAQFRYRSIKLDRDRGVLSVHQNCWKKLGEPLTAEAYAVAVCDSLRTTLAERDRQLERLKQQFLADDEELEKALAPALGCELTPNGHSNDERTGHSLALEAAASLSVAQETITRLTDRIACLKGELANEQPRQAEEFAKRIENGEPAIEVIKVAMAEYKAFYNLSCEFREEDQRKLRVLSDSCDRSNLLIVDTHQQLATAKQALEAAEQRAEKAEAELTSLGALRHCRKLGQTFQAVVNRAEAAELLLKQAVEENTTLRDRLATAAEVVAELKASFDHYNAINKTHQSVFITENGRHGGSPWAELCDAIQSAIAIRLPAKEGE